MMIHPQARWAMLALACALTAQAQQPTAPATQAPATAPTAAQQPASSATQQTPPAALQPRDEPPPSSTARLTVRVNEVDLIFTVLDSKGKFVNGLQQQNFGLLDDGKAPLRVLGFVQQTNLPLRVGVMLDTSSSIRDRFIFEQQAATDFLLQTLHPEDRAFVEGFDVQTDVTQDFTNRIDLLDTGLRKLRPGGGTALFDGLYKTCRDQMLTLQ
ncbi:MAG: VWA domain-containing protein, partial [Bryocella sp.]